LDSLSVPDIIPDITIPATITTRVIITTGRTVIVIITIGHGDTGIITVTATIGAD
jgi:hypothetical protein